MREIRYSRTFYAELAELLEQGIDRFGPKVVAEKRAKVLDTISNFLVHHPVRTADAIIGKCAYHVTGTPFLLIYDYDDAELRIHLVVHASADRKPFDPASVEW